ncbi:MAG TPA: GNAT family N-acetyltransferase [Pseudolabrys sp.]|nr:GNAT family N-acetyltransferase [Pseudolabrys sp.]
MIRFSIADSRSDASSLARFFQAGLTSSYISHAEHQGYRAKSPSEWATDIGDVLYGEIAERLGGALDRIPQTDFWQGVIEGRDDGQLVALAFVTTCRRAVVPFGIIEDVVVDASMRGRGYGSTAMQWIIEQLADTGIRRTFLESGEHNHDAHHLFENLKFKKISIVMIARRMSRHNALVSGFFGIPPRHLR